MSITRSFLADFDLLAVSANSAETALNTEQTIDTSLMVAKENIIQSDQRRESNVDDLTGKEEPDTVFDLGDFAGGTIDFNRGEAQHFALLLSYGLGISTPSAFGGGFKHVITPTSSSCPPSMTLAMRLGQTIFKKRFASMFVDSITAKFERDSWATISAELKGTGKSESTITKETVNDTFDSVALTLAANGVEGSTAQERLDNVHSIRVIDPVGGQWDEVVYTAVSAATPAVITIVAPGVAMTATDYEILYAPVEPAWATFPARVTETPLRVTDLTLNIGGKWSGTALTGGRTLAEEVNSIEYNLQNNMLIEFRIGGTGAYANFAIKQGRAQTLKLDRQLRDYLLQQKMADNEDMVVYMKATGAEFETGKNYSVEIVFPKCNVLKAPITVDGKILAEAGDLIVLEDTTLGSVRCEVANVVATYAA
jgi:hypothetical protein